MATQVTLFPFTGLPAPAGGEPTNHDNNGAVPVRVAIQDPGVDLAKKSHSPHALAGESFGTARSRVGPPPAKSGRRHVWLRAGIRGVWPAASA